jgi:DNA-binding transcriptional LysR family regulator
VASHEHDVHWSEKIPLIAAFDGCIYRKRAIKKLNESQRPWRLIYTIPDLTGIQAAIQEGLGVTVLAKSTVPPNLKIVKDSDRLPKLGEIGITLIHSNKNNNQAVDLLLEFLRVSLVMPS